MEFKLNTAIPDFKEKINYKHPILFLGSCFSDEIANKFKNAGFDTYSNPLGTIFHPVPIARFIQDSLSQKTSVDLLEEKGTYLSIDTSNLYTSKHRQELIDVITDARKQFYAKLQTASHLFITLGTSWAYRYKESGEIVANCHKLPAAKFQKELTPLSQLLEFWSETINSIQHQNKNLTLIFTVSPVRHSKDGLIENNRSKARLFELISTLQEQFSIRYFPSYELVIDELRDYRFFKEDLVHPTDQAIQYIWEKVKHSFFDLDTFSLCHETEQLRKLQQHQILTKNQDERENFERNRELKIQEFTRRHPEIHF